MIKQLKERISSPLFFSFIFSWIFFNWKVTVALLWYDPEPKSLGHLSLINFIENQTSNLQSIVLPLGFAIAYTILSPVIKNLVSAFKVWNTRWGTDWNLNILGGSKVPINKYLSLRENYEKRTKKLEEIIVGEGRTQEKLDVTTTSLLDARENQNKLSNEISDLRYVIDNLSNVSIIDGRWIRTVSNAFDKEITQKLDISGGIVYLMINDTKKQIYNIRNFVYDSRAKKVSFLLFESEKSKYYSYNDLTYEHKDLIGFEYRLNDKDSITYSRPPNLLTEK